MTQRMIRAIGISIGVASFVAGCGSAGNEAATTVLEPIPTLAAAGIPSAGGIIAGFVEAGLPVGDQVIYDEASDPNEQLGRPGSYIAKGAWIDTRSGECLAGEIGWECGGDVEVFDDAEALQKRFDYLGLFANDPPIGGFYMWKSVNAIVRVGFALTPTEAADYENALRVLYGSVDAYES